VSPPLDAAVVCSLVSPTDGSVALACVIVLALAVPSSAIVPMVDVAALPTDALALSDPVGAPSPPHMPSTHASPARHSPSLEHGQPANPTMHPPVPVEPPPVLLSLTAEVLSPHPNPRRTHANHR